MQSVMFTSPQTHQKAHQGVELSMGASMPTDTFKSWQTAEADGLRGSK